jgi:BlaI family transcriptional regulator, penicillinase repressor
VTDASDLPALSETHWEIMNVFWERSECTVADVWKVLNERRGVSRNTVQTLIARLEEKDWLRRRAGEGGIVYAPTVSREESQESSVRRLIETVFEGSPEGLVLTLLNGALSKSEAERIRRLIDSSRRKPSR